MQLKRERAMRTEGMAIEPGASRSEAEASTQEIARSLAGGDRVYSDYMKEFEERLDIGFLPDSESAAGSGEDSDRIGWSVAAVSVLLHTGAYVTFTFVREELVHAEHLSVQLPYVLVVSAALSIVLALLGDARARMVILFFRFVLTFAASYAMEAEIGPHLLLLMSVTLEAGLLLPTAAGATSGAVAIALAVASRSAPVSAWSVTVEAAGGDDLIVLALAPAVVLAAAVVLQLMGTRHRRQRARLSRLDASIDQLTKANVGFQDYAVLTDIEARENERKRISSDIHDVVGHSMTNIIMIARLARRLTRSDPAQLESALDSVLEQAQTALDETRYALRALRRADDPSFVRGPKGVFRLARNFEQATGVRVSVNFANAHWRADSPVDTVIYHAVQEGLTNAFRHGRASAVQLTFWREDEVITVTVDDDGRGPVDFEPGMGLQGLAERARSVGGSLYWHSDGRGFRLRVTLPLGETRKQQGNLRE